MKVHPTQMFNLAEMPHTLNDYLSHLSPACRMTLAIVMLASLLLNNPMAYAALSPVEMLSANKDNKKAEASPSPEEIREELKRRLDEIQAYRDRLDGGNYDTKAPVGIKPEEVTERRRLIESLIFFYQEGLNSLNAVDIEREKLKTIETQIQKWTGFATPPPYSMLMLYGLEEEAEALRGKQAVLESSLASWQTDSTNLQSEVSRANASLRSATETVDRANSPDDAAKAIWLKDFAEWRVRNAERKVWFNEIQARLVNAKLAATKAEFVLLEKKIKQAASQALLSDADLDKVRDGLRLSTKALEMEQQKSVSENTRWNKERDAIVREIETAKADAEKAEAPAIDSLRMEILDARLRAANAWVSATSQQTETLGTLVVFNSHIEEFWSYQYTLLTTTDPKIRQNTFNQLVRDYERLQQWGSFTQDTLRLAVSEEYNQQTKLDGIGKESPLRHYETQVLEAYRLKRQSAERIRLIADRTEHMLARWLNDYKSKLKERPVSDKFKEQLQDSVNFMQQLYKFELFTVDDEVDFEGKKVSITRGVTIGKFFSAFAVFIIGFWFAKWLARRFQRMLVFRFGIDEVQSNVLRRWVLIALSLILLVVVLTFARIPLTAFAFLGGALAIGVGFGTQTMLKNLISGVMILLEHKIKVGDVVEVDNIVGTITEIDIRSSTVHGFDGVETMIPNSTFLESKVTNWTYTNPNIRRSVRIGVAYGTSPREVIQLLLDCAERHGQILDDPEPFVWLEDFGDNALVFGLYFWLKMGPKVSSSQVMSDLRCMIVDALSKAGISIPFPQRDIHFDRDSLLQVSVVAENTHNPVSGIKPKPKG